MQRRAAKVMVVFGGFAALTVLCAAPAVAGSRAGSVTACSHYGNGCVTGAVRRWRRGYQVQLPSGFWEDCERDCRETLRRQQLDFWETLNEDAPDRSGR